MPDIINVSSQTLYDEYITSQTVHLYDKGIASDCSVGFEGALNIHSGGAAYDTVISGSYALMTVSSGGVAYDTELQEYGAMFVSSGGVASGVWVESGGSLTVNSGGKLTGVMTFEYEATCHAASGAILDLDISNLSPGNNALVEGFNEIEVEPFAYTLTVSDDQETGTYYLIDNAYYFNHTITVKDTSGTELGTLGISGDEKKIGDYYYTLAYAGGGSFVLTLSVATSKTMVITGAIENMTKNITSGMSAVEVTVGDEGWLNILSGGVANNTMIDGAYAGMAVSSGGVAYDTELQEYGAMFVSSGGVASGVWVESGGSLTVNSGGKLTGVMTFEYEATCHAASGAILDLDISNLSPGNNALVEGFNEIEVEPFAYTLTVSDDQETGTYYLIDNAYYFNHTITVKDTSGTELGTLGISGDEKKIGDYYYTLAYAGGGSFVLTLSVATSKTMVITGAIENMTKNITSGMSAVEVTVGDEGWLNILSGGVANNTMIDGAYAGMAVSSGGVAYDTQIMDYAGMTVSSGGVASGVCVEPNGSLTVYSGGKLTGVMTFEYEATCNIDSGAILDFDISELSPDNEVLVEGFTIIEDEPFKYTLTVSDIQMPGTYSLSEDAYSFYKSITVKDTSGTELGTLTVNGGEKKIGCFNCSLSLVNGNELVVTVAAIDGIIYGEFESATKDITSGISAVNVIVSDDGLLQVHSGGVASDTTVLKGGVFNVFSGGKLRGTTISSGGTATVYEDVMASYVIVDGGVFVLESGGWAYRASNGSTVSSNTIVRDFGSAIVHEAAWLIGAEVSSGGYVEVMSDGLLSAATVTSGGVYASCGAIVSRVNLKDGGVLNVESGCCAEYVNVSSGGVLTGILRDVSGLNFYGGTLDLNISDAAPGNDYLVDEQSFVRISLDETSGCSLTVNGSQESGTYRLIEGAFDFDKAVTVKNTLGEELGTLMVGGTAEINGATYTLNLTNNDLSVEIVSSVVPAWTFFAGDFNGDLFDTLAVQSGSTVTIYQNGEAWGLGVTLDPGWEVVGVGDFSGDGLDDFLRVNNEGYVVGEMSNGNGTFSPQVLNLKNAGWEILGVGDFNGNGTDDVLIANPTGASETVGLLGYWESGVTWTLINGYSAEWECVSTGDFNADGKCDMLWKNSFVGEGGLTYNAYCTWIVDPSDGLSDWRMVSVANPDEWNFLCSGDFDGNGSHDIAMINDVGVVGIWGVNNGYLDSWSILSAVNPAEWTLAGVADFNADGTDDIAWCNTATGLAGCWQINDKQLTTWANIATVS